LRIAATAAAAVLLAGAIGAILSTRSDTGIPVAGLEGDPAAAEAFAAVEEAYAVYNSGDPEAWGEIRSAGSFFETPEAMERDRAFWVDTYGAFMAAGSRLQVDDCVSHGFGEWPGIADEELPTAPGFWFTCRVTETITFFESGGIDLRPEEWEWVVADGEIVAVTSEGNQDESETARFVADFLVWLSSNHPDIAETIEFTDDGVPTIDSAPTALEYVKLFVEDAPDWPRQTGS
jgi:hypothetical protein